MSVSVSELYVRCTKFVGVFFSHYLCITISKSYQFKLSDFLFCCYFDWVNVVVNSERLHKHTLYTHAYKRTKAYKRCSPHRKLRPGTRNDGKEIKSDGIAQIAYQTQMTRVSANEFSQCAIYQRCDQFIHLYTVFGIGSKNVVKCHKIKYVHSKIGGILAAFGLLSLLFAQHLFHKKPKFYGLNQPESHRNFNTFWNIQWNPFLCASYFPKE